VGGIWFQSSKEADRWGDLVAQQRAGRISGLRRQVSFPLRVNGLLITRYRADAVYIEDGRRVVEDVKGMRTAIYKLKKKLMAAVHGIEIREV